MTPDQGAQAAHRSAPSLELDRVYGARDGFDYLSSLGGSNIGHSASAFDWQLPLPPVRFPLRDALLSNHDFATSQFLVDSTQAVASTMAAQAKGRLKVRSTEKSRAICAVGKRIREGKDFEGRIDRLEAPLVVPKAPPDAFLPQSPRKSLNSTGTISKMEFLHRSESHGRCRWPTRDDVPFSSHAPGMTRSASTEFFGSVKIKTDAEQHGGSVVFGSHSAMRETCKNRGPEFLDAGMGVGPRFPQPRDDFRREPGPGQYRTDRNQDIGSVSAWNPDSCLPTKQIEARFTSSEAHRMGARRHLSKRVDYEGPAPGTYEVRGFADELMLKATRRPRSKAEGHPIGASP